MPVTPPTTSRPRTLTSLRTKPKNATNCTLASRRADKLKSVIVACTTLEGPSKYNINSTAEATLIFYKKLKVLDNQAFAEGEMTQPRVDVMMDAVEKTLLDTKKRPTKSATE